MNDRAFAICTAIAATAAGIFLVAPWQSDPPAVQAVPARPLARAVQNAPDPVPDPAPPGGAAWFAPVKEAAAPSVPAHPPQRSFENYPRHSGR